MLGQEKMLVEFKQSSCEIDFIDFYSVCKVKRIFGIW